MTRRRMDRCRCRAIILGPLPDVLVLVRDMGIGVGVGLQNGMERRSKTAKAKTVVTDIHEEMMI